jgi:cytochrome P450
MSDPATLPEDLARTVVDPRAYAEWDELHRKLVTIRRDFPFARSELPDYDPFWVASKYEDIQAVARQNTVFLSGYGSGGMQPKAVLKSAKAAGVDRLFRSVVAMDEPEHIKYRKLTQAWFQPKTMRQMEGRIRQIAKKYVDQLAGTGGECDFSADIALHYPLMVIMSILGVPEADEPLMLRLTQEYFGSNDADLNRSKAALTPEETAKSIKAVIEEFNAYFRKVSDDRRRHPTDDLATVIANGEIDGRPIEDREAMGYYITVAFAGHDTTSSSVSGALWALSERPDQLQRVRSEPSLIPSLVEEAIRWTTPIHQFVRVAAQDHEIRSRKVLRGDKVILCFPSGNRDEEVFADPFEFRVDRTPNRQIGFGYGAHMCLGMHLARMEMSIFFQELLPRLERVELAGKPRRTITNFVGGPKSVPIRFSMRH